MVFYVTAYDGAQAWVSGLRAGGRNMETKKLTRIPFLFFCCALVCLSSTVPVPWCAGTVRRGSANGCTWCARSHNLLERRCATHGRRHPLHGRRHPLDRRAGALHWVDGAVCEVRARARPTRRVRVHRDRLNAHPALRVPVRRRWWSGERLRDGSPIGVIEPRGVITIGSQATVVLR